MNENIDLTKILKDCPKGTRFYSPVFGEVSFIEVYPDTMFPIIIRYNKRYITNLTASGKLKIECDGECVLFPSKDQRDWSKFAASWYKKEKFDPKTLQPYDKVLVRDGEAYMWKPTLLSYINNAIIYPYVCTNSSYRYCIPYNDNTKYLAGTKEEAPEYYRYWEE